MELRTGNHARDLWSRVYIAITLLLIPSLSGCAAFTNPIEVGIPVRQLPLELLAEPKDHKESLPLSMLRRIPERNRKVEAGDVLGVYIEGVLGGAPAEAPPVQFSGLSDVVPSLGFPIPVREDGTLSLPMVRPIQVEGLTIQEVEQRVIAVYVNEAKVVRPDRARIIVSMMRPRHERVLVIRQDSPSPGARIRTAGPLRTRGGTLGGAEGVIGGTRNGAGMIVDLPPNENDILTALALSGGLPGLDAANEVVVYRGAASAAQGFVNMDPDQLRPEILGNELGHQTTRIPLRVAPGEVMEFGPDEVVLRGGDIVFIEARNTEVFYAGGLLPSGEYPLPRDYDLDAVEAVMQVLGPIVNGGINSSNLSGSIVAPGMGAPSPKLLTVVRRTADGRQVPIRVDLHRALRDPRENIIIQPSDILILQETRGQALSRYMIQSFRLNFVSELLNSSRSAATAAMLVP